MTFSFWILNNKYTGIDLPGEKYICVARKKIFK